MTEGTAAPPAAPNADAGQAPSGVTAFSSQDAANQAKIDSWAVELGLAPAPTGQDGKPLPMTAEQARAKLMAKGSDPEWIARLGKGDAEAMREKADLVRAMSPEGKTAGNETITPSRLPLTFDKDATPEFMAQSHTVASEMWQSLGAPAELAQGFVRLVQESAQSRSHRLMSDAETSQLDQLLEAQWGKDHDANAKLADAAVKSLGKHSQFMRDSLRKADPRTAAWALDALARHQKSKSI